MDPKKEQFLRGEKYVDSEALRPSHTALLLIDLQNDFLDPKGKFAGWGRDITQMQSTLPYIQRLVEAAHKAKVPVIFTQGSEDVQFRNGPRSLPDLWRASYWGEKDKDGSVNSEKGTFGWKFNAIKPQKGDVVVEKHKWSAFDGKDRDGKTLKEILDQHGIKTMVIAGVVAETCVETTIRDAYEKGYLVAIPENGVGSNDPEQLQARMKYWRGGHIGKVFSEEEIASYWPAKES